MFAWIFANLGTLLIGAALLAVAFLIIVGMGKDRKKGESYCGGSCDYCPMGDGCRKRQ